MKQVMIYLVSFFTLIIFIQPIYAFENDNASASIQGQESGVCAGFTSRLAPGMQVITITPNLSIMPSLPPAEATEVLQLPLDATLTILAGPMCADAYTWWFIDYEGNQGWIIEGLESTYYLEPVSSNDNPSAISEYTPYAITEIPFTALERRAAPVALQGVVFGTTGDPCPNCQSMCYNHASETIDSASTYFVGQDETVAYFDREVRSLTEIVIAAPLPEQAKYLAALCTTELIENIYAISPAGINYPPKIATNDLHETVLSLPLEAYLQPGLWTLGFNSTEISIQIPPIGEPIQITGDVTLLAGFSANEKLIAWTTGANGTISVTEAPYGQFEIQVDENGNFLGILPQSYVGLVGEAGNSLLYIAPGRSLASGQYASLDDFSETLYQELWENLTVTPAPTAIPTAVPIPTQVISAPPTTACTNALPSRLYAGARGIVIDEFPNTLRSSATVSSANIGSIPPYGYFYVINGPICADGFVYWQVNYQGIIGWTAESNAVEYWLAPQGTINATFTGANCAGYLQPRLLVGYRAIILPGDRNALNSLPKRPSQNPDSLRIGSIPAGDTFTVLDGPVCGEGNIVWWLVDYYGTVGWTGESQGDVYWAATN